MTYVAAVLVHVSDVDAGRAWYQQAFPEAKAMTSQPSGFPYFQIGQTQLEIVYADEKVATGAAGSVVYWNVEDFAQALSYFESLGAELYRGPMKIDDELWMCQVRDPWGNCIGLRGPDPTVDVPVNS
ncbi:putative enzyme related to lactoylglutathione lyase [Microbacterium sp. ZKA21]|uniref:VOC family protein n=1 Tax=Microbacterium sp. ZKA21 TaxID=3381694 RepID=UPI003D25A362